MSEPMNDLVTRAEFREEIAKLATKEELREAIAPLATKAELYEALAKAATDITANVTASVTASVSASVHASITAEMTRQIGGVLEYMQTLIGVIDEKYKDLPPRVAPLEEKAHTHDPPRPRARRRSA